MIRGVDSAKYSPEAFDKEKCQPYILPVLSPLNQNSGPMFSKHGSVVEVLARKSA